MPTSSIERAAQEGGGGVPAQTLDDLTDVVVNDYTDGKVLRANGSAFVPAVLAHTDLSAIGANTHAQIDTHIADTDNPHAVTAAQAGAVALTGDQTVAGAKTFSSSPLVPSPSSGSQAANKTYVDAFLSGLSWLAPVLDADVLNPSGLTPITGDRYLINGTGAGDWSAKSNNVAEYLTDHWVYTAPSAGLAVIAVDDNKQYVCTGTTWVQFGAATAYTASAGVKLVTNDLQVDLSDTNPSLEVSDGGLRAKVDGSSIERAAGGLQVKALGVTNAMLAGSIADSKLSTISTADKVDWAAVNKTGSVIDDIADVNAPTPSDGQGLLWDAASSKWVPGAVGAGTAADGGIVLGMVSAATTWTNMPSATTEIFGTTAYRTKIDLTNATQFRIVVNQTAAGYSTADLNLQYSTDNVTYQAADAAAAGELAVGAGTGVKVGAWADLVAGAKADVWIRLVGKQGNAIADPAFRSVAIQFGIPGGVQSDHAALDNLDYASAGHTGFQASATAVTMAAAGGVGEFLYTAAADRAAAKSGYTAASFAQRWTTITASKYTATPASTSRITMSDTSDLAVGLGLQYTIGGTAYYGLVTAISANAYADVAGAPLGGDITLLKVSLPEMVGQGSLFVGGTYGDGIDTDLLVSNMNDAEIWEEPKAYIVAFRAWQKTVDTGAEAKVNLQINNAVLSTNDSNNGIQLGAAAAWVENSAVAINTSNYDINRGEELEVGCTAAGGTGDATNLVIKFAYVLA